MKQEQLLLPKKNQTLPDRSITNALNLKDLLVDYFNKIPFAVNVIAGNVEYEPSIDLGDSLIIHGIKQSHVITIVDQAKESSEVTKKPETEGATEKVVDAAEETEDKAIKDETTFKAVPLSQKLMASIATQELQNLQKVTTEIEELQAEYEAEFQ